MCCKKGGLNQGIVLTDPPFIRAKNCNTEMVSAKHSHIMTTLLSDRAIKELRELLAKEIKPSTVEDMTDEEISFIGFFLLEVFVQGLHTRNNS